MVPVSDLKGFSERNIKLMVQFAHEYPDAFAASSEMGQPPVAQLPAAPDGRQLVAQIPWAHNVLLMQRVKEPAARLWYRIAGTWSAIISAREATRRERKDYDDGNFP
jgi:hypothetical protein